MMAEGHRKIELQAQDDLAYLVSNVQRAAARRVEEALPRQEGEGEVVFRRRVEDLVLEYITATFTTALPNISINGHTPTPATLTTVLTQSDPFHPATTTTTTPATITEYEPINARQHSRAADLARQEEELLVEIAALRREAPAKVGEGWREVWKAEEEKGKSVLEGVGGGGKGGEGEMYRVDVPKLVRQEDVEQAWGRGVDGLGRLKRELPGTVARMERARAAGEYVLVER